MRVLLLSFLACLFILSCNDSKKDNETTQNKKEPIVYDMYEPSEMALLMNEMYAHNLKIKQDILDGKMPAEFPLEFLKIHSAELTKAKDRNATFESFSKLFIQTEKEIFNQASTQPIEERFNNAVNVCISCHQTNCTGPIPRIKKLLIK
ncbi:hypothetical protein GCM10022271_13420 [Corallibacter vietnamensis]|uniref:Cytochrome c n=1 Tax=Corallibacter vietnamensis TaxID=904130 RepID=A0ABP7H565_9FLAO